MFRTLFPVAALLAMIMVAPAEAQQADRPQWLAVLSIAREELRDPAAWTAEDQRKVAAHFDYHADLARRGVVIFGGRTQDQEANGQMPADTMGLMVLEAETQAAAEAVMAADPAVSGGIMTVRVRPYRIAFQRPAP